MTHKAQLRRFLAANPFPAPLTDGLFYREKMRAVHRIAPEQLRTDGRMARVLEIGGGRSGLGSLLYPAASIVTLDRDATLLGQGPAAQTSEFVCGDACDLPFPDESFDAVTLLDVLEHIPDDSLAAREALRVTRPGGWVLVSTPAADWRYPYYGFMRRWCPHESVLMEEWGHVRRGYSPEALACLFGAAPARSASFVNPVTAFFHDVGFSRLGRLERQLLYALAAPATLAGYLLHAPNSPGTETAFAWQRT
jgi:SAM-dependent methyltransferase